MTKTGNPQTAGSARIKRSSVVWVIRISGFELLSEFVLGISVFFDDVVAESCMAV
jgi:hypothetical protein